MLKWLCENCHEYRPYTQENCRCNKSTDSMFGDNWDAEEPEFGETIRNRRSTDERVALAPWPPVL